MSEGGEGEGGRGKEGRLMKSVDLKEKSCGLLARESEPRDYGIEGDVNFLRSCNHIEIATMVMLASYESSQHCVYCGNRHFT